MAERPTRALLLSGGGARAAYQTGVLRGIAAFADEAKVPFEVLVGISAGAINIAGLAANAADFQRATHVMSEHWGSLSTSRVFRVGTLGILANALRWVIDLSLGGMLRRREPRGRSLVDSAPLAALVDSLLPPGRIAEQIERGLLHGVAISCMDYSNGALTTFVESSRERTLWRRSSRTSRFDTLTSSHVLASCALPFLFPAVKIGAAYFGDGSIHNTAPLSPAIHLGARKILAVGVRPERAARQGPALSRAYPMPALIAGVLLDSIFMDSLEADREQMERINDLIATRPARSDSSRVRHVDLCFLRPSEDLVEIALRHRRQMPRIVRYMLRGLGTDETSGGELLSYLLFERTYCAELMDLGERDARARKDEIKAFLWG